jgi:hypothetical protein
MLTGTPWPDERRARPQLICRHADYLEPDHDRILWSLGLRIVCDFGWNADGEPRGEKAAQLGNSDSHFLAERPAGHLPASRVSARPSGG